MKKFLEKVKAFFLKFKGLIIAIVSILVFLFVGEKIVKYIFAKLGKVDKKKNFKIIDDTTIVIVDDKGNHKTVVKLPVDETGKQIKSESVIAAGTGKGGITVEIKHTATDRTGSHTSGN